MFSPAGEATSRPWIPYFSCFQLCSAMVSSGYLTFSDTLLLGSFTLSYPKGGYHKHGMFLFFYASDSVAPEAVIFSIPGVLDGLEPQRISSHAQHHMHQSSHPILPWLDSAIADGL
jgi:hypothetical protein